MTNNVLTFTGGKAPSIDDKAEALDEFNIRVGSEMGSTYTDDASCYVWTGKAPPQPEPPSLAYGYSFLVIMAVLGALAGHWLTSL